MTGRSWFAIALAIGAALVAPAAVAAQTPTQDSAMGSGNTTTFTDIEFAFTSGPSGENPTGSASVFASGIHFTTPSLTCLRVEGNTATAAGPLEPQSAGFLYGKLTVVDNGPAESGLDIYAPDASTQPFDCSTPVTGSQNHLINGDIVVVDAPPPPPLPSTKDQCENGGWKTYGVFKNQGDCVSLVATGGKNPPANGP
jgi:hypothetical protein